MQKARVAASAGGCYRELPITLRVQDGTLVEGIADLVFLDADNWIVVDFKTDQELAAGLPAYRRQVSIYAAAIRDAKKAQTLAFLLRI
jgi:ATP-dependent exoDNAse (exonuclease V) beta subunit